MLIDETRATGSPAPIFSINPGIRGIKVGITTAEELEKEETIPTTKARIPVTFCGLEILASHVIKISIPPAFSTTETNVLTPQTIMTTLQGIRSEEHTSELQSQFHLVCRL